MAVTHTRHGEQTMEGGSQRHAAAALTHASTRQNRNRGEMGKGASGRQRGAVSLAKDISLPYHPTRGRSSQAADGPRGLTVFSAPWRAPLQEDKRGKRGAEDEVSHVCTTRVVSFACVATAPRLSRRRAWGGRPCSDLGAYPQPLSLSLSFSLPSCDGIGLDFFFFHTLALFNVLNLLPSLRLSPPRYSSRRKDVHVRLQPTAALRLTRDGWRCERRNWNFFQNTCACQR